MNLETDLGGIKLAGLLLWHQALLDTGLAMKA